MNPRVAIDVHLTSAEWKRTLVTGALRSLSSNPPYLDPVWFYDARGSELFDEITRLPEYYPTRAERALLELHAPLLAATGASSLVELGSGTSDKTTVLLDALTQAAAFTTYVPFDVSEETLRIAAERLALTFPRLCVHGVVGDFHHHLAEIPAAKGRLVAFLGSTIGNLNPAERRRFFADLDCALDRSDLLLLGIDLIKDRDRLIAAYNDSAGVTAEFNRNALRVLNATIGSDFSATDFEHVAVWDETHSWIEMRLRASGTQRVNIPGLGEPLVIADGDELRTEISTKFTVEAMTEELWNSGFVVEQSLPDAAGAFALLLARPYC